MGQVWVSAGGLSVHLCKWEGNISFPALARINWKKEPPCWADSVIPGGLWALGERTHCQPGKNVAGGLTMVDPWSAGWWGPVHLQAASLLGPPGAWLLPIF